jgi:hypothetical protein
MAYLDKVSYEDKYNNVTTGLFKDNATGEIGAIDNRTLVTDTADSFTSPDEVQNQSNSYAADTGSVNAYVIALTPAITNYTAGQTFRFLATNANTGASTLNVNSQGAVDINKDVNVDLAADDIKAGQVVTVVYDGSNFQLVAGAGGGGVIPTDSYHWREGEYDASGVFPILRFPLTGRPADGDWQLLQLGFSSFKTTSVDFVIENDDGTQVASSTGFTGGTVPLALITAINANIATLEKWVLVIVPTPDAAYFNQADIQLQFTYPLI